MAKARDGVKLPMYVIYRPATRGGDYVARRVVVTVGDVIPDPDIFGHSTNLEALRHSLPAGLHRLARFADDDPSICEVWL